MSILKKIRVFANCDMTLIAWQASAKIPDCRGFAIERQIKGAPGDAQNGYVNTYVGFEGQSHKPGEAKPSTEWPVQRYMWNDFAPSQGQTVRYRVLPMIRKPGKKLLLDPAPQNKWSDWSDWVVVGTEQTPGLKAYFNRGIVGAQFLSRQFASSAEFKKKLTEDISSTNGNSVRKFLSGPLRVELLNLLKKAKEDGGEIYAALYELNDPEVIDGLTALGKKCYLILASGAFNKKAKDVKKQTDENYKEREVLRNANEVNLYDRIVGGNHFAHNKFIVFCDKNGKPVSVWTGSTNTTVTGLCTQVNNGILIEDESLAAAYKTRWSELQQAGNGYPPSLSEEGSAPEKSKLGAVPVRAWNVPCNGYVDLKDAKSYIQQAKEGVLFLMFNPGTGGANGKEFSLLQDIQALGQNGLYIHGVINQAQAAPKKGDPGGGNKSTVQFTQQNELLPPVSTEAITPHEISQANMNWFHDEYHFSNVMIHSKVVVIDPFGAKPVVMTGSHNLGPKASKSNDDNLVIIENALGLAQEYAVNILGVYGHYKWLYNAWKKAKKAAPAPPKGEKAPPVKVHPSYDGNKDTDAWQDYQMAGENLQQTQFLMGEPITPVTPAEAKAVAKATSVKPAPSAGNKGGNAAAKPTSRPKAKSKAGKKSTPGSKAKASPSKKMTSTRTATKKTVRRRVQAKPTRKK
jgi:hypothetical protein